MAQTISYGDYTIHIDGSKLSVADPDGHVVATADLSADAAAKIPLPDGRVLDMGQLADALASDHIADFATAAGGAGGGGAGGSGMFFTHLHQHFLSGFDEVQVLQPTSLAPSSPVPEAAQQPTTFIAQQSSSTADAPVTPPHHEEPPINHAPSANDDALTTAEDTAVAGQVSGIDPDGDSLGYQLVTGPAHGSIVFNGNGTFTYTPTGNYNGTDSFTYKANDGSHNSNTGTVNLTVTPVNDAPVAADEALTTKEDTTLHGSVTAIDVDGDHLSYSLVDGPQHGTVTFNADGTFIYTPNGDYNGADSFTYKANDGTVDSQPATVSLTVTPVNDAPVAADEVLTTKEDTAISSSVTATDVDGDHLSYSLINGPQHGTVAFNADGTFIYTPTGDYNGTDSFTYTANDGTIDSQAATINLTVTPVNDAPVAADDNVTTAEDTTVQGHVTAIDVDSDHLSYSLVDGPQHGTVTFNADGSFFYTPNPDYNGADSFTFKSNDGSLDSNTATVNLNVTPVNDPPIISVDSSVTENHFIQLTQSQNPLGSTKVGDYLLHPNEGQAISDTSMINGVDPSNISLTHQAPVTVSFVAEGAGYQNMVGVYSFDSSGHVVPGSVQFLWLNASSTSDNTIGASLVQDFLGNTQQHDISLGNLTAGTNLGFFMIANGAGTSSDVDLLKSVAGVDANGDNDKSDLAAINSQLGVSFDSNGNGHITVNGVAMSGDTYFSSNQNWNTDASSNDIQHVISGVTSSNDGKLYVGFEDLAGGGDRDYNDVVFSVDIGDYNLNKTSMATVQPHIQISDIDSSHLSAATLDTHGFVSGDSLHVPSSSLFDVNVTQSGDDYHISITAKSGSEGVDDFQSYLNSIYFTSTSGHEGARTLDYTVTDDQHATSSIGEGTITVHSSYDISASTLAPGQTSLGSGDDHLHLDTGLSHILNMGDGDNTVSLEQNNGNFTHNQAQYLQNVDHVDTTGFGTNTVKLSISDVLDMTDGGNHLTIVGDNADTVKLTGDGSSNHWQQISSHDGFNVYTWSDPSHHAVVEISNMMHQTAS
jgi:VCBS repeat-containing protein